MIEPSTRNLGIAFLAVIIAGTVIRLGWPAYLYRHEIAITTRKMIPQVIRWLFRNFHKIFLVFGAFAFWVMGSWSLAELIVAETNAALDSVGLLFVFIWFGTGILFQWMLKPFEDTDENDAVDSQFTP